MNTKLLGMLVLICFTQTVYSSECDAILEQGVRNTYLMTNSSNFKRVIISNFCRVTDTSNDGSKGGSADVNIPIVDIDLGFSGDYNEKEVKSTHEEVCTNNSNADEGGNFSKVLKLVADPQIVSAWSQCKNSEGGVLLLGKALDEKNLLITMSFRNAGSVYQTEVTDEPILSGMTCSSMIKAGQIIDGSTRSYACKRYAGEPASLIINNKFNGVNLYIPPTKYTRNPPVPDNVKIIPKWEYEGCPNFVRPIGNQPVILPMIDPQSSCFDKVKKYCLEANGNYSFLGTLNETNKFMCADGSRAIFGY